MKEIWILFVMFVHIVAYNNPSPRYSIFKTGPEYASSKECLNDASEWITHEILKMAPCTYLAKNVLNIQVNGLWRK